MILITGATGFLGMQLIKDLVLQGKELRAIAHLRKLICTDPFTNDEKVEWIVGDISDKFFVDEAFENITQVYHCAGIVSFKSEDKELLKNVNAIGTSILVNAALEHKVKKFLYVSSVAAMGQALENEVITESKKWEFDRRLSPYAITKFLGEQEVWRGIEEGLNAVIVNPSMIIGLGGNEKEFNKLFQLPAKGSNYYTEGTIGMVDVRDVSLCMLKLMESNIAGERFIVSAGNISIKELFLIVAKKFNQKPPEKVLPNWVLELAWRASSVYRFITGKDHLLSKFEARSAMEKVFFDNHKITKALDYSFIPLEESINNVCEEMMEKKNKGIK